MERFENEVKALHVSLEQVQATLTSPELARLSLKEQLTQRQVHFSALILNTSFIWALLFHAQPTCIIDMCNNTDFKFKFS